MKADGDSPITHERDTDPKPSVPPGSPGVQEPQTRARQNVWSMPLGSVFDSLARNQDSIRRFLSLTGGSILYCLSALSIVYGITQIIGPPLAKSSVLGDILPCVGVLNVYELALLAVLMLVVVWRNVTDDAISLVVLIALFLVASGMTLGVVAPSGLNICLAIGIACVLMGLCKLFVLRRYIGLRIGVLSAVGLTLIMAWTFLGPSLMARPLMARAATDELRRNGWLLGWLVLLAGAILIFVEAAGSKDSPPQVRRDRKPFIQLPPMALIFALVLLAASGFHQYGFAYMFAVDYVDGDFIPLAAVMSLLLIELARNLPKQWKNVEVLLSCVPLALAVLAVPSRLTTVPTSFSIDIICYPPVTLALTSLALLWTGYRHRCKSLRIMAIVYALGVLLTLTRGHEFNVRLFGGGLVATLLIFGAIRRNPTLCFAAVLTITIGLASTDAFTQFAKAHNLTVAGAAAGSGAIGIIAIALIFGRSTPRLIVLCGAVGAAIGIFDYLPRSLHWVDVIAFAAIVLLFAILVIRTKDIAPCLVLWIPVFPRAYLFVTKMSSWSFVVLSFLLLFLGATMSLFLKRRLMPDASPEPASRRTAELDEASGRG
jgi:hypothetical protein